MGAFKTPDTLYYALKTHEKKYKYTRDEVDNFLSTQASYTTHKRRKRSGPYRFIISPNSKYQYDIDTGFMKQKGSARDRFIIATDIFDLRSFAVPVSSLKAPTVVKALTTIFNVMGKPRQLRSDFGSEFVNKTVKTFFPNHWWRFCFLPVHPTPSSP